MKIVALELRRSLLLKALLPAVALWLWMVVDRSDDWVGSWPAATTYSTTPVAYVVILVCAVVGSEATRRRASGLWQLAALSPRRSVATSLHQFLAQLICAALIMAVPLASASVWNARSAPSGWLWPGYVAYAGASLLLPMAAAYLLGVLTTSRLVGATGGAALGLISGFYGGVPLDGSPAIALSQGRLVLLAAAAAAGVAVALVLPGLALRFSGSVRSYLAPAVAALTIAGALVVLVAGEALAGPVQVERAAPEDPACSTSSPKVCVWPEHAAYLGELQPLADRATAAAAGVFPLPAAFNEYGLQGVDSAHAFKLLAHGDGLWFTAGGIADTLINETVASRNCFPTAQADYETQTKLIVELEYWLQSRAFGAEQPAAVAGSRTDVATAQRTLAKDSAAQKTWARAVLRAILDVPCQPGK